MAAALLAGGMATGTAMAQDKDGGQSVEQFLSSLHYQNGTVALADANAKLNVGEGFRYLGHDDARRVLEDLWGNPPDDEVLGLIVPTEAPLGGEHSWAVVVTYSDDGYVSDEDAQKIDYDEMLANLKKEATDDNAARKDAGYGAVDLVGWAQPPHYDAVTKRLYWAKELAFEGEDEHTLNYDIRVLGRKGYLSLNAVANMGELAQVRDGMARVLPMAEFDSGQRYADYSSGDKTAAYGLAALVAGVGAAKLGLFAKLGALLLAFKKVVVLAFVGIAAGARKVWGKITGASGRSGGTFS